MAVVSGGVCHQYLRRDSTDREVLDSCFLFQALDKKELSVVIDAMKEKKVSHDSHSLL